MTTFNAAILITADATAARRELGAVADASGRAGSAVGLLGRQSSVAGSQIAALVAEVGGLRQKLEAAVAAEARAAAEMGALVAKVNQLEAALGRGRGRGSAGANGAVGNLIAQFNDVGVTLAAGGSPLLIAVQQGTQISQALGQAGAAGAVRTLGQAFVGMLAPTNLAVFAAVAGIGLLTQGLRGLTGETQSVEDAFGDLEAATKAWREAASVGVGDLAREFGSVTPEIIEMQRQLTELRLTELLLSAADAARTLGEALNPGNFEFDTRGGKIAELLGADQFEQFGAFERVSPKVQEFEQLLGTLRTSVDGDEQIAALDRMQALILQSAGGLKQMNDEQREFFGQTVLIERQLRLTQAAEEGIGSAQRIASDNAYRMLATLRDEANIRDLIALHGEKSREVAEARHDAERRVFEASLATLDVSDLMKRKLTEAWEAANGLQGSASEAVTAFLDAAGASDETQRAVRDAWDLLTGAADATNVWASAMSGVAAEVRGIGSALADIVSAGIANASKEVELEALRSGKSASEARLAAAEAEIRREGELRAAAAQSEFERKAIVVATEEELRGVSLDRQLAAERAAANERERAAAKGASGRSGGRQTEGASRLISSLERELDLLRATDPVQKEMIRNREALAKATDDERAIVEQLIATKIRETEQQKQSEELWEFTKNSAYDALDALIIQGEKASDVMANLARSIASALLQSALLGTGPLAGLFGGQGTGLFGIIGEAVGIPAAADGGLITGPGGPRDDKVLSWLSNGEYVVNAAATARHRPLLEAINSAPRFADGGIVGGASGGRFGAQGAGQPIVIDLRLTDDLDARVAETSRDVSLNVMRGGIREYDAKVLPRRLRQVQADPRRVG